DDGQRRLPEAGGAGEEHVIEAFPALPGGLDGDLEALDRVALTHILVEAPGAERALERRLVGQGLPGERRFTHGSFPTRRRGSCRRSPIHSWVVPDPPPRVLPPARPLALGLAVHLVATPSACGLRDAAPLWRSHPAATRRVAAGARRGPTARSGESASSASPAGGGA